MKNSRYRCTTCQLVFDEPKISFIVSSKNKKEPFEVCPRCSAFVFKEQEKVESHINMAPVNQDPKYTKLNEETFEKLISRFSNSDLLTAIQLISKKYKEQRGELSRLDDQLWKSVSHKQSLRQF